jgi:hypothetical protein
VQDGVNLQKECCKNTLTFILLVAMMAKKKKKKKEKKKNKEKWLERKRSL